MKIIKSIATFVLIIFFISYVIPISCAFDFNENTELNETIKKQEENVIDKNKKVQNENTKVNEDETKKEINSEREELKENQRNRENNSKKSFIIVFDSVKQID